MSVLIILFYGSLFTVIAMIVGKLVSLRKLKLSLLEGVEREFYGKVYSKTMEVRRVLRVRYFLPLRTFARALFFFVAHQVLHAGLILGNKIKVRHNKWYNMVKGKGAIRQKGSVSFFLQNVSDHKKSMSSK